MRPVVLTVLVALLPAAALGQSVSGRLDGSARDPDVSGRIDARIHDPVAAANGNDDEAPLDVRRAFQARGAGGPLQPGDALPDGARIRSIPGYSEWGTSVVNGQRVIVNRDTGVVSDVGRR